MVQLIEYGGKGKGHWVQLTCSHCGAWLKEMPDRYEKVDDHDNSLRYNACWECLSCGKIREEKFCSHPDSYTDDKEATLHKAGSWPESLIRDPYKWHNSEQLTKYEKDLVKACWNMIDELSNEFLVHQIGYIWNLSEALKDYDVEKVKDTAGEYIDMLDYESVHGQRPGSYDGVFGDVTEIKKILKLLKE